MNNKYKTLIKDTVIFALGSIGSKCIVFFLVPLYTNYLSTEQYGTAELVFTIAQIFIPIVSIVIFDAVIRYGLERRENPENVLAASMLVWIVGSIVLFMLLPLLGLYEPISEWIGYLYLYIVANILLSIELNYLKVKGKNLLYSVICIVHTFSLALLNIVLLIFLNAGVKGYLVSNIAASIIVVIISFFAGEFSSDLWKSRLDMKLLKEMVCFSSPLILNNLAWWIIQSSDKIMIQMLIGSATLGLYTVATRIPSLLSVVVSVFQQSWGISSITEMDSDNDTHFYSEVFKVYTFLIFFAVVILNSIIKYFMKIYVSNDYYIAWKYVPVLVCAAAFSAIGAYFGAMYGALKKPLNNMISTVLSGVINIILNFIFIPLVGVGGAVIGTITAYIFLAFYRLIDCRRYVYIDVDLPRILIDGLIIVCHGVTISMDFMPNVVSIASIASLVLINSKTVKKVAKMLWGGKKHG